MHTGNYYLYALRLLYLCTVLSFGCAHHVLYGCVRIYQLTATLYTHTLLPLTIVLRFHLRVVVEPSECCTDQTHFTSSIHLIQSTAN